MSEIENKTVTSQFYYYTGKSESPVADGIFLTPGDIHWDRNIAVGAIGPFPHTVYDMRFPPESDKGKSQFELFMSRGFMHVKHETKVTDLYDENQLRTVMHQEMADLVKSITGCDAAACNIHTLRLQGKLEGPRESEKIDQARNAAFHVHVDWANDAYEYFLEMHEKGGTSILSDDLDKKGCGVKDVGVLRRGRMAIINCWRPITKKPVKRFPLAILDARSIGAKDLVSCPRDPSARHEGEEAYMKASRIPVMNTPLSRYNPDHRWYYLPDMLPEDVLVFKNFDSGDPDVITMHTAFAHPDTKPDDPPRESFNCPVFCFWYSEEDKAALANKSA